MKPRNFRGRKFRRVANVLRRAGKLAGSYIELPKDIRLRIGAAGRKEAYDGQENSTR